MADQFRRAYELVVGEPDPLGLPGGGGFGILSSSTEESLRITFTVERDERPWPNKAVIEVYNLNPDHRDYCSGNRGIPCRLEAGYPGGTGTLFAGVIRSGESYRDGQDWVTVLTAGDGEVNRSGQPLASGQISKAWARGTPLAVVVADFAKELDVDLGNVAAIGSLATTSAGPALAAGLAVDGPVLDEWIALMRSCGLAWSIQDGALQLRVPGLPAGVAPIVSPFTGLVEGVALSTRQVIRTHPVTKKESVQEIQVAAGRSLLLPGLIPGHQMLLQSRATTGLYMVASVRHVGDSRGQDWYTEFEAYD
jgi:hypothetical protein